MKETRVMFRCEVNLTPDMETSVEMITINRNYQIDI